MFDESIIYYIGAATTAALALGLLGLVAGVMLSLLAYKGNVVIFPRLTFFMLEKMRSLFKFFFSFFSRDRYFVERMAIKILNHLYRKRYSAVPTEERMIIFPQCLRDLECPARLDPVLGFACKRCGRCVVEKVRQLDGTDKIYISPGGTFSVRILESSRPLAVLGVACPRDLFEGMAVCHSLRIPVQGVSLLRTGCVATDVDFNEVSSALLMGSSFNRRDAEDRRDTQSEDNNG